VTKQGWAPAQPEVSADVLSVRAPYNLTLPFQFRSVWIGLQVTLLGPLAATSIFVLAGFTAAWMHPYAAGFATVAMAAAIVTMLPWPRSAWGLRLGYAWLAVDILLFTVGWAPSGRTGLLFIYAVTTAFFAISFPPRAQVFLLSSTIVSFGLVHRITKSDLLPIVTLAILAYLANFLSRELREQMAAYRQAHFESERRWTLAATVSAAARNMTAADPRGVLTAVVDSIVHLGYQSARIYVRHEPDTNWEILLPGGRSDECPAEAQCLPPSVHRAVLGEGKALIVRREDRDPEAGRVLDELGFQTMVAVPILAQDRTEAVMIVGANDPWDPSMQDLEVFRMLAAQAGLALENAHRFEDQGRTVERMAELDRLKRDFLSTVSHELRTPLTVISGMGLTLERQWTALDEEVRLELLARLNANAQTLEGIITRLLDFSRLEAGRLDVQAEQIDLGALIESIVTRLEALTSGHALFVELELGLSVRADPVLLERIFENLLSNAVKYTPRGSHIRISAFTEGDEAVLAVSDDGPGIPEDELPHLGEQFFRGGDPQTRATRGTGLGLSLVSEILRLHGSKLHIESRVGAGATFSFRLPDATGRVAKHGEKASPPLESGDQAASLESTQSFDSANDVIQGERFATVLAAAQMGTEWAIATLYRELNPRILRYLKAFGVRNANGIAAEVWREMTLNVGRFDGDLRSFRRWLFSVARRRLLESRRQSGERFAQDDTPVDLSALEADQEPSMEPGLAASLARISSLPEDQAEIVLLRVVGDLTPFEVADILGRRPATVRSLEQQGLEGLRRATPLASVEPGELGGA